MAIIIQQREPALRCSLHELINSLGMHSFHSKNSAKKLQKTCLYSIKNTIFGTTRRRLNTSIEMNKENSIKFPTFLRFQYIEVVL